MESIEKRIRSDETAYESSLRRAADAVCSNKNIKLVLVAGGSCAGKTTTASKLAGLLTSCGRPAHVISLDDYYRNEDEAVYLPDGTKDIESLNSLRVDMIRDTVAALARGDTAFVPRFDFIRKTRTDAVAKIRLEGDAVALIEGLHALNPALYADFADRSAIYGIFLFADSGDGRDCRFIRRLVRDARHRGADAARSFELWDNVRKAEKVNIDPFASQADLRINTYFDYESGVLCDDAIALLHALPEKNAHADTAESLVAHLYGTTPIDDALVPADSLLREFI